MTSIIFVCHGNICRSPMAEYIMKDYAKRENLNISISSAAVSYEEIGNDIYPPAKLKLREHSIGFSKHKAHRLSLEEYLSADYVIVMDNSNLRLIQNIIHNENQDKIYKMLSFIGSNDDVADPWYSGDFEKCYQDISKACIALCNKLKSELK